MSNSYNLGVGRKRPGAGQPNYHQLSNNAVFPNENSHEVIQNHTKKMRTGGARLAPTLRGSGGYMTTAELQYDEMNRNISAENKAPNSPL